MAFSQLQRLQDWTSAYGNNYVSHGVVPQNECAVLRDGTLRCAESILRRMSKLEFEVNNTTRSTVYLPDVEVDQEQLEAIKKAVIEVFDISDEKIEETLVYYHLGLKESKRELVDEVGKLYGKLLFSGEFKLARYNKQIKILKQTVKFWREAKQPKGSYANSLIAIFVDMALPKEKRCKRQLARIYQIYEQLMKQGKIEISTAEMEPFLASVRSCRFFEPLNIKQEIGVHRNDHDNSYGNLKIFIGGAEPVIGLQGEYSLPGPAQNGGKFFKVDLSNPNVLIIGPRNRLKAFENDERFSQNIIFSENVPVHLFSKV